MIQENKTIFKIEELEPILFKNGFKKEIIEGKEYFFLNRSIYIKFEYGFLIFFYLKNAVGFHKDRKFLNLFIFFSNLNSQDRNFLYRNIKIYDKELFDLANEIPKLKELILEKIEWTKNEATKSHYKKILCQIDSYEFI